MAANKPVTNAEKARILELHATGMSRNDICRETGRAAATVTKTVRDAGRSFDRTATKAATEAKKADAASLRAQAQLVELEILRHEQTHVRSVQTKQARHKTIVRSDIGEMAYDFDFIPSRDMQQLANARSSSAQIIRNLAALDTDQSMEAAKSLAVAMAEKFGLVNSADA